METEEGGNPPLVDHTEFGAGSGYISIPIDTSGYLKPQSFKEVLAGNSNVIADKHQPPRHARQDQKDALKLILTLSGISAIIIAAGFIFGM